MYKRLVSTLGMIALATSAIAASPDEGDSYRLYPLDLLRFEVYGEPDLATELRISGNGDLNVPLAGSVHVQDLSLAQAQEKIARIYQDSEIFIRPRISLRVVEYSKKEVSVLGQVGKQGKIELPPESSAISIVEAITAAGGFTRIAKSDAVRVTRRQLGDGNETRLTINVETLLRGSGGDVFMVRPGDVIFVPERLF
ncbi:sugar transporter [Opitutaceae bacterium TAV5]|nr:sugar transporter [Opitutaceae bacterium TAV5]